MTVRDQDQRGVAVAVAAGTRCLDQLLDLGRVRYSRDRSWSLPGRIGTDRFSSLDVITRRCAFVGIFPSPRNATDRIISLFRSVIKENGDP